MAPTFDRLLWRLFREHGMSVYTPAAVYLAITVALALASFVVIERRTRSRWRQVPAGGVVRGEGPYRRAVVGTFLGKAPLLVRMTSLAGIIVGTIGLVWPALLVMDLEHPTAHWGALMLVEAVATATTALSFVVATRLLRRVESFGSARGTHALHLIAVLLFVSSVACLLHAFDGVEVTAYGIKWHDTMTFGAFTRSGFVGVVDGHFGLAWRVVVRAASIFGVVSASFIALYARVARTTFREARPVADVPPRDPALRAAG